jgi:hypothetical protein
MNDSNAHEAFEGKHDRNRQQRIKGIKRWVEYIETHDPSEWGEQQNRLVDSQLESARRSGIDVDHRRRVERTGRDRSP